MDEQAQAGAGRAVPSGPTVRRWVRRIVLVAGFGAVAWLLGGTTAGYADSGPRTGVPGAAGIVHADPRAARSEPLSGPPLSGILRPGPKCPPRPVRDRSGDRRGLACPLSRIDGSATRALALAVGPARPAVRTLPASSRTLSRLAGITAPVTGSLGVPVDHPAVLTGLLGGPAPAQSPDAATGAGDTTRPTDSGERPSAVPLSGRPTTGGAEGPTPTRSARPRRAWDDVVVAGVTAHPRADQPIPAAPLPAPPSGPGPLLPTVPAAPPVPVSNGSAGPAGAGAASAALPADRPAVPGQRWFDCPCRYRTGAMRQPGDDPSVSPD